MALQKNLQLNSGVQGDYWRITGIILDFITQAAEVHISLYLSKDYSDGGSTPINNQTFTYGAVPNQIKPKPFPFSYEKTKEIAEKYPERFPMEILITIGYLEIKKEVFFQDALDV